MMRRFGRLRWRRLLREGEAEVVLIAGSRSGREYSPRVAVKLDAPLLEDVTSLKDEGGVLHAEHYTFLDARDGAGGGEGGGGGGDGEGGGVCCGGAGDVRRRSSSMWIWSCRSGG